MEELLFYLAIFAIVLYILYLIVVYVVLPIVGIILAVGLVMCIGLAAVGLIAGAVVAVRNFVRVFSEAHMKVV